MCNPKISVVIPVYNAERYIERAVKSVMDQTVTDWELIIVDDGSKDNSLELCRCLAKTDNRIRVFTKPNGGEGTARNYGLDRATGEYLCYVDADDHVSPTLLSDYLGESPADIAICGIRMNWGSVTMEHRLQSGFISEADILPAISRMELLPVGSSANKLYRRELIERNHLRFPVELQGVGMDHVFNWQYFQLCKSMRIVGKMNYIYEENPCSNTHVPSSSAIVFADRRLQMMESINDTLSCITDCELRGKCQKIYHTYFSDTIVRPLYINKIALNERHRILRRYRNELKRFRFNTFTGAKGFFNRIINLLQHMPVSMSDQATKMLFQVKKMISHG